MECPICWEEFDNSAFSLSCGHLFHKDCITLLSNSRIETVSCPLCRTQCISKVHKHFVREVYLSTSPKADSSSTRKDPISKSRTLAPFRLQNKRLSEEISDARKQLESSADRDMALLTSIRDLGSELEVSRSSSAIYKAKYAKWRKMAKKSTTDLSLVKRERDVLKVEINRLKRRLALDDSS